MKHYNGEIRLVHGTMNGYRQWCCRCELCLGARRTYRRELKERRLGGEPPRSVTRVKHDPLLSRKCDKHDLKAARVVALLEKMIAE